MNMLLPGLKEHSPMVATRLTASPHVLTVLGTRPEMIRLSRVIRLLDDYASLGAIRHTFVHLAQNTGKALKEQFYADLNLRREDVEAPAFNATPGTQWLGAAVGWLDGWWGQQAAKPDRVLILGDTFSAVAAAYVAKRRGALLYHAEAGNRCFDPHSPEELNRRIVDHVSDIHMCYTEASRRNLTHEGITRNVHVVGNPLLELVGEAAHLDGARYGRGQCDLRPELDGKVLGGPALKYDYYLCSLHRAENVDVYERVQAFMAALARLGHPAIVSTHPRLEGKIRQPDNGRGPIRWLEPTGFSQWVRLEACAKCVITDSGSEPEEAAFLNTPSVILRDSTERPELIEHGCSMLAGCDDAARIEAAVSIMERRSVTPPPDYDRVGVAEAIAQIVCEASPLRSGLE